MWEDQDDDSDESEPKDKKQTQSKEVKIEQFEDDANNLIMQEIQAEL